MSIADKLMDDCYESDESSDDEDDHERCAMSQGPPVKHMRRLERNIMGLEEVNEILLWEVKRVRQAEITALHQCDEYRSIISSNFNEIEGLKREIEQNKIEKAENLAEKSDLERELKTLRDQCRKSLYAFDESRRENVKLLDETNQTNIKHAEYVAAAQQMMERKVQAVRDDNGKLRCALVESESEKERLVDESKLLRYDLDESDRRIAESQNAHSEAIRSHNQILNDFNETFERLLDQYYQMKRSIQRNNERIQQLIYRAREFEELRTYEILLILFLLLFFWFLSLIFIFPYVCLFLSKIIWLIASRLLRSLYID